MKHVVAIDLDGCLTQWNPESAKEDGVFNWSLFFSGCMVAKPDKTMPDMARFLFEDGYTVHILSSRPEITRWHTETWLRDYGIPHHRLIMNDGDINLTDFDFKIKMFIEKKIRSEELIGIFDDCPKVVEAFRGMGLPAIKHECLRF